MRTWTCIAVLITLCTCVAVACAGAPSAASLVAQADALYDRWGGDFDFATYAEDLDQAIALYRQALPQLSDIQSQSAVLNRLSQATFEYASAYIADDHKKEEAFSSGKEYALQSLRLDSAFVETSSSSFRKALSEARDPVAVFWYGNNFGSYLNYHQLEAIMGGGMRDVPACYERAMALDPSYLAGAPARSLASYLAQIPTFLGGDLDRASALFEQAIAFDPDYLENSVGLAEFVLKPRNQFLDYCSTLHEAVTRSEQPDIMAAWPLYNHLTVERAKNMLEADACP